MHVHAARQLEPHHLAPESIGAEDQLGRDAALAENALFVIDVAEEEVERCDTLGQAAFELGPFAAGNNSRDQIKRKDPLDALLFAVNREGDALIQKRRVGGAAALREKVAGVRVCSCR